MRNSIREISYVVPLFIIPANRYFEDPPPSDDPPGKTPEQIEAERKAAAGGTGERKFTQAEVDRIVKADKDKAKRERDKYLEDLETLKAQGLTPENMDSLNQRIEALQNEGKTKEQLASEERGKLEKKFKGEIEKEQTQSKFWKQNYEQFRSQTEILTAASAHKAFNNDQVYQILRPNTVMVEKVGEDGKPTGEYIPRVKFQDEKDGQAVTLDLSVAEAVKRMTEMERHQNLFESGVSGGLGGHNNGRSGSTGTTTVPTDTKSYMEARKKDPNLLRKGNVKS